MTLKLRITFSTDRRSWSVPGNEVPYEQLTTGDMMRIGEVEAYLARITGLKVKIETAE